MIDRHPLEHTNQQINWALWTAQQARSKLHLLPAKGTMTLLMVESS
jgi:hypothetical protein